MNLNQPTLSQFEYERLKNKFIPIKGSNSFYQIGNGEINIYSIDDDINYYRFDLYTKNGCVHTGPDEFKISGDISIIDNPYNSFTIIKNTSVINDNALSINMGSLMNVHGILELTKDSTLSIMKGSKLTLFNDSTIIINDNSKILIDNESSLIIYGHIKIHLSVVETLLNTPGITIDSAAVMEVTGLEILGKRVFSITDYYTELSNKIINKHTQGEKNFDNNGRIGYTWTEGDPLNRSQYIKISTMNGNSILGDFKLSVLGLPEIEIPNIQIISDLHIQKNTTLYITENFNDNTYIKPNLYLGCIIGNNKRPGKCIVDGTIIVDGENTMINIDRKASLEINGEVYLKNNAQLLSTYNDDSDVLFINGTLIIETIEQINSFEYNQIVIGSNGKIIILNPETEEKKLLWTTPHGIEKSDLYRLFKDRIDHVEYHISKNTGIGIDQYYDFYSTQFTKWYGNRRIEQAIYEGLIVWHDGGFIELYNDIIPWVETNCTLLHAGRLFKTFGSYDEDKLQDAVNRLKYAGCGNILFRFIDGENIGEITLNLEGINMKNVVNYPLSDNYILDTNNTGKLFLRNKIGSATQENIINEKSRIIDIEDIKTEITVK